MVVESDTLTGMSCDCVRIRELVKGPAEWESVGLGCGKLIKSLITAFQAMNPKCI